MSFAIDRQPRRRFASLFLLVALTLSLSAQGLGAAEGEGLLPIDVGQPVRLEVFPARLQLTGRREQAQLVVTGHYADGSLQDLTRAADWEAKNDQVIRLDGAAAYPVADGTTEIVVTAGGQQATIAVEVTGQREPQPVSFQFDTLAALSKNGCNSGACHGSPSGKGGFRLSLRAFDAVLDQQTLVREELGRRTNPLAPETSLLLAKPTMRVPHGGGMRLRRSDAAYQTIHDWIAEGCQVDSTKDRQLVRIEVQPPSGRVLKRPAHTQQLAVLAHFSDGTVRDVTQLAVFSSSDTEVATVDERGLVVGHDRGEVAVIVRYLAEIEPTYITFVKEIPGFVWNEPPAANYVDELVHTKLRQLKFLPSAPASDGEFLRRAYLDVIGVLPTVDQTNKFLADASPNKRAELVDALLERPEYAKFWALKWGDLLRLTKKQIGDDGVYKYHRWLERAFARNMPYDEFATQLLTASGSTLVNPPANYFRTAADTSDALETTAQIFLGARIQCAKCHNHPFERWTQDNYYGMSAFFNRVERKKTTRPDEMFIYFARSGEVTQPRTGAQMEPWAPGADDLSVPAGEDRRLALARWIRQPDNPFFARVEVNRIWAHLFGAGIVEPFDDFRDTNPPSNAALLDALAADFVKQGYDRKHILRTILNSQTYQTSTAPSEFNQEDAKYASHYQPRMLSAEQLLDALGQVIGVPEAFAGVLPGTRATQLPAPDMANLEFLKVFGQPERQTACQCERSGDSNLSQALQLYNGELIHEKLRGDANRFRRLAKEGASDEEIITNLYLAAYCRRPTPGEMEASLKHIAAKPDRLLALEDICWAIVNTNEFLFQH